MFRKITAAAAALAMTATLAVAAVPADAARYMDPSGEDTTWTYDGPTTMESENTPPKGYQSSDTDEFCKNNLAEANYALDQAWKAWGEGNKANQHSWELYAAEVAGGANADKEHDCNITEIE